MRGRIDLEVPYAEKDEAKSMGAYWDPARKTWYVPPGWDPRVFARWLPAGEEEAETELIPPVYAVESTAPCWRCDRRPRVATVAAESFIPRGEPDEPIETDLYLFSGIEILPRELLEALRKVNPGYRKRFSPSSKTFRAPLGRRADEPIGDWRS